MFKEMVSSSPNSLEDITLTRFIVPPHSQGHVLVTMRTQDTRGTAFSLSVGSMDTDAGVLFLLLRAMMQPHLPSLHMVSAEHAQGARVVSETLGGFPLALDQAGAYMATTHCEFSSYLDLYKGQKLWVLQQGDALSNEQQPSVMGTLELVFQQFARHPGASLDLLQLLAFLHPYAISERLFIDGLPALGGPLRQLLSSTQARHQAFAALLTLSLLSRNTDTALLHMQPLVQQVLIEKLPLQQRRAWARLAVRLVNHVFPEVSSATWNECQRYLPHAEHCAHLIEHHQLTLKEGALLFSRCETSPRRSSPSTTTTEYSSKIML